MGNGADDFQGMWRYLHHAHNQIGHAIAGFLYAGIMENLFFMYVQLTLMTLVRTLHGSQHWDRTTLGLIGLNLLLSLLRLSDFVSVRQVYKLARRNVLDWKPDLEEAVKAESDSPSHDMVSAKLPLHTWGVIQRNYRRYLIYVIFYFLALAGIGVKVIGMFYCPCRLWSWRMISWSWPIETSCLDFSQHTVATCE